MARAMAELTAVSPFDDHYEFGIDSGLHDLETALWSSSKAGDMLALLMQARQLGAERISIALDHFERVREP
jgi:hypothetical protein